MEESLVTVGLDFNQVIEIVDDLVLVEEGRRLSKPERIVMRGIWDGKIYEEIAKNSPYSINYLQRNVATVLWEVLTKAIGDGVQVNKKSMRYSLERVAIKYYSQYSTDKKQSCHPHDESPVICDSRDNLQVMGEQSLDVSRFYGRIEELKYLRELIGNNSCVALLGAAGIGKSALAAKLISEIAADPGSGFDFLCWKYIRSDFSPHDLVTELISLLASPSKQKPDLPPYAQARISVLINYLKSRRCLLVLDGADAFGLSQWDGKGGDKNSRRRRHEEFRVLLRRLMEEEHQSCFVLTGRQRFSEIDELKNLGGPVSILEVKGLDSEDAKQLLRANNLKDEEAWDELIEEYGAVPAALELISKEIQKKFNGRVKEFNEFNTLTANSFKEMLEEHFQDTNRLGYLERQIIIYLAEEVPNRADSLTQAIFLRGLKAKMESSVSTAELLEKIEFLINLSLIQREENIATGELCFSLQPLLKRYAIRNRESLVRGAA